MGKLDYMYHPTPEDQHDILRYLLGSASARQQEALEIQLLTTPGLALWSEIIEDELVEDYVCDELPAITRRRFERHYLTTPARRFKLQFIRALVAYANSDRARRHLELNAGRK